MSKDQDNSLPPGVRDNANFMGVPKHRVISPQAGQLAFTSTPPLVLRVTTKEQLVDALGKDTTQVVIADKNLARPFEWYLWAKEARKSLWPIALIVMCLTGCYVALSYPGDISLKLGAGGVRFRGLEVNRIDGEIRLTRTKPAAPHNPSEE
jgi:hypothetical protein